MNEMPSEKPRNSALLLLLAFLLIVIIVLGAWLAFILLQGEAETGLVIEDAVADLQADTIIEIPLGVNINEFIQDYEAGSVFRVAAGVHRLQTIIPRDGDVFLAEDGAVLNGAIVLDNFEASDNYWLWNIDFVAAEGNQIRDLTAWRNGLCLENLPRCNDAHRLYFDNRPLSQANSLETLAPMTWFIDYDNDVIYLGSNPEGHLVELSINFHAFTGDAENVFIYGFTIEKYAGTAQSGAIRGNEGVNWRVENNLVRLNSGGGIEIGTGMLAYNNRVLENGQIGISGIGDDARVIGNEIAYNNFAGYDAGWEAGGTKFVRTNNLLVSQNYVHHNEGPGLWTDGDNLGTIYEDNLIVYNAGTGILHEISYDATIRNNILMYNFPQVASPYVSGQIRISSSANVEVYGNQVVMSAAGGNAIVIVQQDRGAGSQGAHHARGNSIHDNTIVLLSDLGETLVTGDTDDATWLYTENRFNENTYYVVELSGRVFGWENAKRNWNEFRAFGQESDGEIIEGIPLNYLLVPAWRPRS